MRSFKDPPITIRELSNAIQNYYCLVCLMFKFSEIQVHESNKNENIFLDFLYNTNKVKKSTF